MVGSGLLGVELASSLTRAGLEVDLLIKGEHPWSRFAGETTARWVSRYLDLNGVKVHAHGAPLRLEGDGRVQRVVLPDQTVLPCDFAVAAVGVVANKELLRRDADRGGEGDPHRRVLPHEHRGGLCGGGFAALFDPLFGKHRLLDHFDRRGRWVRWRGGTWRARTRRTRT